MPKITAVIPVYNVQQYLPQCLDSVVSQTLKDIEIICVDDGSTDSCPSILDEYATRDNRIKVIHQPNGGYGKAMNAGLRAATGEYFAVLESDDCILPDAYEILYANAKRFDADVVRADYFELRTKDGKPHLHGKQLSQDYSWYYRLICPNREQDVYLFPMHNWTGIHRISFLRDKNIWYNETPGASYQDNGFFFQVYSQTERLLLIPRPCYCYRFDNPNSSIHSKEKVYAPAEEYQFIRAFLQDHPEIEEQVMPAYYARFFRIHHQTYMRIAEEYREDFAVFFRQEMLKASDSHQLRADLLTGKEQSLLKYLLESEKYFEFKAIPPASRHSLSSLYMRGRMTMEFEGVPGLYRKIKKKIIH